MREDHVAGQGWRPGPAREHSAAPLDSQHQADPILALLARIEAAIAREGLIEVDGRTLLVRPISGGYALGERV